MPAPAVGQTALLDFFSDGAPRRAEQNSSGCRGRAGPAIILGFSSPATDPFICSSHSKGLLCATFHHPFWTEGLAPAGGGEIPIFRISQQFPFPGSFAHPERLSSGCSLPRWGDFNQAHGSRWPLLPPGAFAACPGAVPILLPSPRLLPAAHTGSSVVETLFWICRVHECKHCKSYSRKVEAPQECFQVQVFLRCPGSAQSSHQQCFHEHWDAAD